MYKLLIFFFCLMHQKNEIKRQSKPIHLILNPNYFIPFFPYHTHASHFFLHIKYISISLYLLSTLISDFSFTQNICCLDLRATERERPPHELTYDHTFTLFINFKFPFTLILFLYQPKSFLHNLCNWVKESSIACCLRIFITF